MDRFSAFPIPCAICLPDPEREIIGLMFHGRGNSIKVRAIVPLLSLQAFSSFFFPTVVYLSGHPTLGLTRRGKVFRVKNFSFAPQVFVLPASSAPRLFDPSPVRSFFARLFLLFKYDRKAKFHGFMRKADWVPRYNTEFCFCKTNAYSPFEIRWIFYRCCL